VPLLWAQLTAGHLPHSTSRPRISSLHRVGKESSTTLPPDSVAWGPVHPHCNRNMEGERSSNDKVSPANGGAVAGNQSPL
jgi:hypothetical protein